MAAAVAQIRKTVPGDAFRLTNTITGDTSYPTGGYTITPQQLGYGSYILQVMGYDATNFASAAYVPVITATYASDGVSITSLKLQLINYGAYTEVTAATNVSTISITIVTEGR